MINSGWFGETFPLDERLPTLAEYYRGHLRLAAEPGTVWTYSDHGFAILGQIVEDVRLADGETQGMLGADRGPGGGHPPTSRSTLRSGAGSAGGTGPAHSNRHDGVEHGAGPRSPSGAASCSCEPSARYRPYTEAYSCIPTTNKTRTSSESTSSSTAWALSGWCSAATLQALVTGLHLDGLLLSAQKHSRSIGGSREASAAPLQWCR